MKKLSVAKRMLAALLSIVMIVGIVPIIPWQLDVKAADNTQNDVVSLPITIRDFAADGMLFEWNEIEEPYATKIDGISSHAPNFRTNANYSGQYFSTSNITGGVRYTITSTGAYITFKPTTGFSSSDLRYAVIKYRTSTTTTSQDPTIGLRNSTGGHYVKLPTTGYGQSSWKTVVLDMTTTTTGNIEYFTIYPRMNANATFDLSYIAFFDNKADADSYAAADGNVVSVPGYIHGATKGFGFVNLDDKDEAYEHGFNANIPGTTLHSNGTWNSSTIPAAKESILSNGAPQKIYGALVRTDLVKDKLGANKQLLYTEATVTWLAEYMEHVLNEPEKTGNNYNLWYVMGEELFDDGYAYVGPGASTATKDLADVIRYYVVELGQNVLGSYTETTSAIPSNVSDCHTWFDAAYFLLHNLFADQKGYGMTIDEYNSIQLVAKEDSDGNVCYVFNSAYDGTVYDTTSGIIYNGQTNDITIRKESSEGVNDWYARGNAQPLYPFNPIPDMGYGNNGDIYSELSGNYPDVTDGEEYYNRHNYNLTLEGHAKFIFYNDMNLYFTFTGDDDVYLFINGVRVLDLGGAHAISKATINLNDVAELCGLEDGAAYDFDFYYMERHGTAANFGIETNIRILDPAMTTTKNAYQNNAEVGYNGYVNANEPVVYRFGLTNNGETPLYNLTFTDEDIECYVGYDAIRLNDETLPVDLAVRWVMKDGNFVDTVLKAHHTNETATDWLKTRLAQGIGVGESIYVYGFRYTIRDKWVVNGDNTTFVNRVVSTASAHTNIGERELTGLADFAVKKSAYLFPPQHIYTWGKLQEDGKTFVAETGNPRSVTMYKAELLERLTHATDDLGGALTAQKQPDYALDFGTLSGAETFAAAGFPNTTVLNFQTLTSVNLGNLDLSEYSMVEISYCGDQNANFKDLGVQFVLTEDGAEVENSDAETGVIVAGTLGNATGHYSASVDTISIAFSSKYKGNVYLSVDDQNSGHGPVVTAIKFIGKDTTLVNIDENAAYIELCSASGMIGVNTNKRAVLDTNTYAITYTPTEPGMDTYYYVVSQGTGNAKVSYGPIAIQVFTYGTADSAVVLDYGLSANLAEGGIYDLNVDYLADNMYGTSCTIEKKNTTENFGTFNITGSDGSSIVYNMNRFMSGVDSIDLTLTVLETGKTEVNKYTGVVMDQTVEVVPANVMYYEDTFDAIDYKNDADNLNVWLSYAGATVKNEQTVDQNANYGSDAEVYKNNTAKWTDGNFAYNYPLNLVTPATGAPEYAAGTVLGDASNDTLHVLQVKNSNVQEIMQFEFRGTGFEILSRTTQTDYAVITVVVDRKREDGTWDESHYKVIPVIAESVGGDLFQIPLIDRKDFPLDDYRVTVLASNGNAKQRTVYIDGVRIYQPLSEEDQKKYYNPTEANASFYEIKTQIKNGNIVFGEAGKEYGTENVELLFGYTMIENYRNVEEQGITTVLTDTQFNENNGSPLYEKDEYMKYGPNNEIYLAKPDGMNFIAFYVEEIPGFDPAARTIQVGAHVKYNETSDEVGAMLEIATKDVELVYASSAKDLFTYTHKATVSSGTEQYITIEPSALQKVGDKYLVLIARTDGEFVFNTLALTNLKLNGYTLVGTVEGDVSPAVEAAAVLDYYDRNVSPIMREAVAMVSYLNDENEAN